MVDIFATAPVDKNSVAALIDSDGIAYRAAAVTDGKQYAIGKKAFKYKKDVITYCEKNNLNPDDIEEQWFPEPLAHALKIVDISISGIKNALNQKYGINYTMEFYHTHKVNFRDSIVDDYKASRKGKRRPSHLNPCKEHIAKNYREFTESGLEADDLLGIRAYECSADNIKHVIVSNDKDLKTIPGTIYDWVKKEWYESKTVEAMKFFYAQTIAGDDTDGIPGVMGLGINPKGTGKAQKIMQAEHEALMQHGCPAEAIERMLYERAFEAWMDGGPGKNGSYGCKSLSELAEDYKRSAQCLFILHHRGELWQEPTDGYSNYLPVGR